MTTHICTHCSVEFTKTKGAVIDDDLVLCPTHAKLEGTYATPPTPEAPPAEEEEHTFTCEVCGRTRKYNAHSEQADRPVNFLVEGEVGGFVLDGQSCQQCRDTALERRALADLEADAEAARNIALKDKEAMEAATEQARQTEREALSRRKGDHTKAIKNEDPT